MGENPLDDLRGGEPAVVVTHVLLDSTLLGEGVLPALRDAFGRGLALPGAASVPWGAQLTAQLVESPSLWARRHPPVPAGSALATEAACCDGAGAAQSLEASAWLELRPDGTAAAPVPEEGQGPVMRCVARPYQGPGRARDQTQEFAQALKGHANERLHSSLDTMDLCPGVDWCPDHGGILGPCSSSLTNQGVRAKLTLD